MDDAELDGYLAMTEGLHCVECGTALEGDELNFRTCQRCRGDGQFCSESCPMCAGEACLLCGAGCWNNNAPFCDHAVDERHMWPERCRGVEEGEEE